MIDQIKVAELESIVNANPKDHAAWFELGKQFFDDDFHRARVCFSRAIALEPFNADYVFNRGWKALSADEYEMAMADFATAIRLAPIDGFKWHYLANSYFFLGDYEQAAEYYRMAITMYQKTGVNLIPPAVDWIWMCNMRLGRKDKAQEILDEFITPDIPVEDSDYVYKKRVLLYAGYTSIDDFIKNVDMSQDIHIITEFYAASSYYNFVLGDKEKAMEMLEKVLAVPTKHHGFGYKLALMDKTNGLP